MLQAPYNHAAPGIAAVVIMGVAGSGKSTLGALLGRTLDCPFLEGDDFHSADAVAKMRAGTPLASEDRWPWLDRLGAATGQAAAENGLAVAACSALRRCYRDRLVQAIGASTRFVLLDSPRDELQRRLGSRPRHYMPPSLLDSQIDTLERPGVDERALVLDATGPVAALCNGVMGWLAVASAIPQVDGR